MMKKKSIYFTFIFLPFFAAGQTSDFTIKGNFENRHTAGKVFLSFNVDGVTFRDSVIVSEGRFQLKGRTDGIRRASLNFRNSSAASVTTKSAYDTRSFYLEPGTIIFSTKDSLNKAVITGSATNADDLVFNKLFADLRKERNRLYMNSINLGSGYPKADSIRKEINKKLVDLELQSVVIKRNYIKQYPSSYFSLMSIQDLAGPYLDKIDVQVFLNGLSPQLLQSKEGVNLQQMVENMKSAVVGKMAPQFTHADTSGRMVNLSDFKGRYVLVDFWASWCHPCRAENPYVLKAYNKYKDNNFTVVGVSIDRDIKIKDWLRAIKEDGMPWTQLLDGSKSPDGASMRYGIKSIPSNFLIDPSGKIIAKNLRGENLEKALSSILTQH